MPSGELLCDQVALVLHTQTGKTVREIADSLDFVVSDRAIRYAVVALIAAGKAKRLGRRGHHFRVLAVVEEHEPSTSPD